jgi:hypothetical protein
MPDCDGLPRKPYFTRSNFLACVNVRPGSESDTASNRQKYKPLATFDAFHSASL